MAPARPLTDFTGLAMAKLRHSLCPLPTIPASQSGSFLLITAQFSGRSCKCHSSSFWSLLIELPFLPSLGLVVGSLVSQPLSLPGAKCFMCLPAVTCSSLWHRALHGEGTPWKVERSRH